LEESDGGKERKLGEGDRWRAHLVRRRVVVVVVVVDVEGV
jgi:hypothetical protein